MQTDWLSLALRYPVSARYEDCTLEQQDMSAVADNDLKLRSQKWFMNPDNPEMTAL